MHFPGVPVRTFDAAAAGTVYRDNIIKENNMRAIANGQMKRLPEPRRERSWIENISDMLPGLASINEVCTDLGYTYHHGTGRRIPPVWETPRGSIEGSQTGQTPLHRSLSSFQGASTKSTPLRRSLSSFKDAPMTRSLSSFKDMPMTPMPRKCSYCNSESAGHTPFQRSGDSQMAQTPLRRSLSSFSAREPQQPFPRDSWQAPGLGDKSNTINEQTEARQADAAPQSQGSLSQQVAERRASAATPVVQHGPAVYLQMCPREVKREILAQVKGLAARKRHGF